MFTQIREEILKKLIVDGVYKSGKLNSKQNVGLVAQMDDLTIPGFTKRTEKILALRLNLVEAPKCYCGNYRKFSANSTLQNFCSPKCAANSPTTIGKRANTWDTKGGKTISIEHRQKLSSALKYHFTHNDIWNKGNHQEKIKVIQTATEIHNKKERRKLSAQLAGWARKQKTIKRHLDAAPDTWTNVTFHNKDNTHAFDSREGGRNDNFLC